ncbi:response regulator [candidate division KSB1 bacterium]|nr:response regulator [candidate division KSB1 bacterium]
MGHRNNIVLIVDNQPASIVGLKNGLQEAGYEVFHAEDGNSALEFIRQTRPCIVLSDVTLPNMDGHRLLKALRSDIITRTIPFIFLSEQKRVDDRISSIALGVDDYIVKPYFVDEVLARIEILLKELKSPEEKQAGNNHEFAGKLSQTPLVNLIQKLESDKISGILNLKRNGKEGQVYIKSGQVIDAILDKYPPEQALKKMFVWTEGEFWVESRTIDNARRITFNNKQIISAGNKILSQWKHLIQQMPSPDAHLKVKSPLNQAELQALSPDEQRILENSKNEKSIWEIIDQTALDDIQCLQAIRNLYANGLLVLAPNSGDARQPASQSFHDIIPKKRDYKSKGEMKIAIMNALFTEDHKPIEAANSVAAPDQDERVIAQSRNEISRQKMKNQIYLTKGELLMIREKLV